ncbi:MAG: hypothetical protein Q9168_002220 [Polycauliona sp. 1 TL-2023]
MSTPSVPPAGGDRDQAPMLRAVLGTELAIASIVVILRFFTRLRITRSPGWDDWIMLATFVCAAIGTTMDLVGMTYGIGRHVYYLKQDDAVLATKLDWLCQAFVITAVTIGKVSVAFFILRLSNTKWHFYFLHTINATLALINIPLIIWTYAQCRPSALLWDPNSPGTCQDPKKQGSFAIFQGYDATSLMVWYTTEMYVIIIAGSLPTLRPLFEKSVSVYRSYRHRSSRGYQSYHHDPHEMQPYRKQKHAGTSVLHSMKQDDEGSSDKNVLATNAEGITKTVDITFASSPGAEEGKKWERWEERFFGDIGTRENESV